MSATPASDYRSRVWSEETGPQFVGAPELAREKPPAQSAEGLAYEGGLTVLVGESGTGKGFITTSLCTSIVQNKSWLGRRIVGGSAAYLSFEADALSLRLAAQVEQGDQLEGLYILRCSEPLSPAVTRDGAELPSIGEEIVTDRLRRLAARLEAERRPPLRLVVVDTARSAMTGSEDSSENVAPFIRAMRRVTAAASPTAAGWLILHAGWQDGETKRKRERGSSAWRGLVEVTLFAEVEEEAEDGSEARIVLRTLKARDSIKGRPFRFIRRRVCISGFDAYGEPLTSCVIVPDPRTAADREAEVEEAARAQREAEAADLDRRVLDILAKQTITSQDQLRQYIPVRRDVLGASLARLLSSGKVTKDRQRSPFVVQQHGL